MSILNLIQKGNNDTLPRIVVYGQEGVGKTSFAAEAPTPVFICAEDGLGPEFIDIPRAVASTFTQILDLVQALSESCDYKTVVLDSIDWIERTIHQHICDEAGKKSIEDFPFGKGFKMAEAEFNRLLTALDVLRRKQRVFVILLAHSHVKPFSNPEGEDYERWELKCHKAIAGLTREWPDALLFYSYDTLVDTEGKKGKALGGERVIHTTHAPAFDAKNRLSLPEKMVMPKGESWKTFAKALAATGLYAKKGKEKEAA